MNIVLGGVVTLARTKRNTGCFDQARATLGLAHEFAARSNGGLTIVGNAQDFLAAVGGTTVGCIPALEGAHALEGSIDRLDRLIDQGLRSVGLAHFHANECVACSWGPGGDRGFLSRPKEAAQGLSDLGRALIDRLNERRIAVDLAHTSRAGFMEAAARSQSPPFVSHTGVAGAHRHWRNIDDEQIRAVINRGGIIGVIFAGRFLGGSEIDDVVRHIEYLVQNFGDDGVAIGSDWDGMIIPVRGLEGVDRLWRLTATLLGRGHSEERVAKILGRNAVRYLADVTGWSVECGARAGFGAAPRERD